MKPLRHENKTLAVVMVAALLLLSPGLAWSYGGGGGSGGDGGGGGGGPLGEFMGGGSGGGPVQDPWTPSELNQIFGGLTPNQRSDLVKSFSGSTVDKRSLLEVRQVFNRQNMRSAQNEAKVLDAMVTVLEVLDKSGQLAQDGLSFVPGVGWVTSATLGAARSGADAYKSGASGKEIAIKALSGGAAAGIMGKFSGADQALRNVRRASGLAVGAMNKTVRSRARTLMAKAATRFLAKKQRDRMVEGGIKSVTEEGLRAAVNTRTMPNRASIPSYSPRGGFTQGMLK